MHMLPGAVVSLSPSVAMVPVVAAMAAADETMVVTAFVTTDIDSGVMMDTMRMVRDNTVALRRAVDMALDGTMTADRVAAFKVLPTILSRG